MLSKIAWRNLWRNKTRTGIVISAIAFSYGLMLFSFGVADDSYVQMSDNIVAAVGGHVLVHGEGYWDLPSGGQSVENPDARREAIEEIPDVDAVSERVLANGLLATAETSEGAQIVGVVPEDETPFYDVSDQLVEGQFFSDERDEPIVIGREQADTLGAGLGDRVVITASGVDGEVTRGLFYVDGIIESAPGQAGAGRAYVRLEDLQEVLGYGDAVTQIGIRLADGEQRHPVASTLRDRFEGRDLEVLTWDQAVPEFVGLVEFDQAFTYMYVLIIMIIVGLGIANTLLMAVMERVREIGLFSALGLTPRKIGAVVLLETTWMTLVAMGIGLVLGLCGHFLMASYGIDVAAMMDVEFEMAGLGLGEMVIHSHINPQRWIIGSVLIFVLILLCATYPAWKATRLAPAEAMRFYE